MVRLIQILSLGFLKVFLDLPLPLSLESVFLVGNASSVLFIISQVLANVMASGARLVFVLETPGTFVEFVVPHFMMVLDPLSLYSLHYGVMV